jgi:LysM repeat protein
MAAEETAAKGSVKLFGQHMSKKTLGVAALVGVGVIGYAYYRKSKGASSASTATTATTDPATGYPYGSAEDTAALAAQDSGTNTNLSGVGSYGAIDPNTGIPYAQEVATGGGGATGTGTTTTTASVTNSQWEQEAISDLEAGGVAQSVVNDAESGLPRYLAKLKLSSGQATAVQMAVGLAGPPPEGGPFSIIPSAPAPIPFPPKKPVSKTVTANGKQTLDEIARANKISEADLLSLNAGNESIIKRYWGTGKPVPKGSKWKV